ncbi:MAG TPA: hypothetical protein VM617_07715 [Thermoanaerobaculia bacterium]|nr:hypothetical protein [Thermoanaerobaculia bacterium]
MARIVRTLANLPRSVPVLAAVALVLWLAVTVPLAAGWRTLYFRDVFGNHLPVKAFGAEALARGEVPAFNPRLGVGQPFRGNPAALAFYPDNLLYLVLPLWSAFNLHFALHWLLAALSMFVLARQMGQGLHAALLAGLTYGGSGFVLSGLTFYNVVVVAAWWPLAMAGAVRGGRRGTVAGGVACGLALLGGEPLLAALGLLPMLLAAVERHGGRRGVVTTFAVGAIGLAVALPQLVATLRILDVTFRGAHGPWAHQVVAFTLSPLRYLELVMPLPFGWPMELGPRAWWLWRTAEQGFYFLSLHVGIVALWLAAGALRRRPVWGVLAIGGLALAWLAGGAGEALSTLSGGTFRYPEKLLFWYALTLPLLAGWGLEAALERPRPRRLAAWLAGGAFAAAALVLAVARPRLVAEAGSLGRGGPLALAPLVEVQSLLAVLALALAAVLLLAAGWALGRRRPGLVVALQLAALLPLHPLVASAPTAPFRSRPPWLERVPPEAGVVHTLTPRPGWEPVPPFRVPSGGRWQVDLRDAADLEAVPGVLHGLRYPLWPDMEGFSSPLYTYLTVRLARADWPRRLPWLRTMGVDAVVAHHLPPPVAGLEPVARAPRHGVDSWLLRVESPAPEAWWPRRVEVAPGPAAAFDQVSRQADPLATVVASRPLAHDPSGRVELVANGPDRIEVEVESGGGGLLVLRRSYHPIYRARSAGEALDTQPVNLTLLGVAVPPGRHRVVVDVDGRPEGAAAGVSLAVLAVAAVVLLRRPRRRGDG